MKYDWRPPLGGGLFVGGGVGGGGADPAEI